MQADFAPNWRDPCGYAGIAKYGRAGLAWELLRRDPLYRAAARQPAEQRANRDGVALLSAAAPEDLARWGLHFRRRCAPPGRTGPFALVGRPGFQCSRRARPPG